MPEVRFTLRWPDGLEESCYSPSTAIKNFVVAGETYPLPDFLERARTGLNEASNRVAAKYGFACSSAMGQLARIEFRANQFAGDEDAAVTCLAVDG